MWNKLCKANCGFIVYSFVFVMRLKVLNYNTQTGPV